MSYFDRLVESVRDLRDWADLRHEQGLKVAPEVNKLIRRCEALKRRWERSRPSAAIAKREPNRLRDILAARPDGPRRLWPRFQAKEYTRRLKGAWLARAAGCTLGAVVEGWPIEQMQALAEYSRAEFPPIDYWPVPTGRPYSKRYGQDNHLAYTRGQIRYVPVDDDLTYTLLGLLILEDYGPHFTTAQVGQAWLKYLPMACTAEKIALENLRAGVGWSRAGMKDNPFLEWIGADIRSDPWGYAAPGWPEKAAELAYRDAYISHRNNGIYGEMYFSAVIASAFALDDPLEACRVGLTEIPRACRLHEHVVWALRMYHKIKDFRHARRLVDERFAGMHSVHTLNNACLTIFGLALGGRDVTKVIGNTVAMGMDNDCTTATAGSIVGAVVGVEGVPEHWYKPFGNKVRTYMNGQEWFTNTGIFRRFPAVARCVWQT
jgi:ADP-ribosylglycohydrolase